MAIQFYKKPNDPNLYEVGTDRVISATEFGLNTPNVGRGFVEQKQPAPPIKRDADGLAIAKSPFADYGGANQLIQTAKEIILRKQGMNKDLTDAGTYWRKVYSDTTAFGTQTPDRTNMYSNPKDINFRELSPADQAGIRLSRQSAANANLRSIAEERKYRGDVMGETLDSLASILKEQQDAEAKKSESAQLEYGRKLDNAKKLAAAGIPTTAEDWGLDMTRGIGDKVGGTPSWRMNNPGLIKYDEEVAKKYGAKQGLAAEGGGYYAIFPSEAVGTQALKDAFDAGKADPMAADLKDTIFGSQSISANRMTDEQWQAVEDAVKTRNKWEEGNLLSASSTGGHTFYTEANIRTVAEVTGVDVNAINAMSDADIASFVYRYKNNVIINAAKKLDQKELALAQIDADMAQAIVDSVATGESRDIVIQTLNEMKIADAAVKYDKVVELLKKADPLAAALEKLAGMSGGTPGE